jgi:CDP-6-deoxy-D-xylo-4-hexulose-3-dehydrase
MIKLIKSSFYHEAETKRALADFVLKTDIFSMGRYCRQFEELFAAKQGRKHAVYVANGSVANLLLIQAMLNTGRLKPGDRVGFSALTWPTNVMPLIQLGLVPVALDCRMETLNVSPEVLEREIGSLKALFLTNVLGFCDDIATISRLCTKHNVTLLEDNCESLGSKAGGWLLGNYGQAATFSFFIGHHLSTIEGGMVVTDDDELHEMLLIARAHGWDRNLAPERQKELRAQAGVDDFYARYTFYDLASNFRSTEINGFIGTLQMQYWDEIVERRVKNFHRFQEAVAANDDFYRLDVSHMETVSNFSMPVIARSPDLAAQYLAKFEAADVEVRPVIAGNMTRQPFYHKYVTETPDLPHSDTIHANGFYFGNNPEMTDEDINTLCGLLKK